MSRRRAAEPAALQQTQTGIVLATAVMYLRILIIVAVFDFALARALAPALLALAAGGLVLAGMWYLARSSSTVSGSAAASPTNPLELSAAFIFAALFVVISLAATWVRTEFGESGLFGLAAIVGFTDIDPFVLSVAAGGAAPATDGSAGLPIGAAAAAILIASSSNNLLKAAYAVGFAGFRAAAAPAAALLLLALGGAGAAWWSVLG